MSAKKIPAKKAAAKKVAPPKKVKYATPIMGKFKGITGEVINSTSHPKGQILLKFEVDNKEEHLIIAKSLTK